MRILARHVLLLLSISLLTRNLGPLSPGFTNLAAAICLIVFIGTTLGEMRYELKRILPGAACAILGLILAVRGNGTVGVAATVLGVGLLARSTQTWALSFLGCGIYALYHFAHLHIPLLWDSVHSASLVLSRGIASLLGRDLLLGPTVSGLNLLILFLLFALPACLVYRKRMALFYPLLAVVFFTSLVLRLNWQSWTLPLIGFGLFSAVYLASFSRLRPAPVLIRLPNLKTLPGIALVFISTVLVFLPFPSSQRDGKIYFYDQGILNWKTPEFGVYEQKSGGMFGKLPYFLNCLGYETEIGRLDEGLKGIQTLVFINTTEPLEDSKKQAIWNFVEDGGSLLVLADHTNLGGSRDVLNPILAPFSIELNFDSAKHLKYGWEDCLEFLPHPITLPIKDESYIHHWIGASVAAPWPARPIITGKYAFSDAGDAANKQRAYLGDMKYQASEAMGDVVLVASENYGRGRVLVFGDTSAWHNLTLPSTAPFAAYVFTWLHSAQARNSALLQPISLLLLFLGILALLASSSRVFSLGIALLVILTVPMATRSLEAKALHREWNLKKVCWVDLSHDPLFDFMGWQDDSIGGLLFNIMRNGYFPLLTRSLPEKMRPGDVLIEVAPTRSFSRSEMKTLHRFLEDGGFLLVTVGWEQKDASSDLLESFGAHLDNVPLGPAWSATGKQAIVLHNAWPISLEDPEWEIIYSQYDYPLVAFRHVGKGAVTVIGDSGFLLNPNLEGLSNHSLANIMFLRRLFAKMEATL